MKSGISRHLPMLSLMLAGLLVASGAYAEQSRDWTAMPNFTELRLEVGASEGFVANCGISGRADNLDALGEHFQETNWADAEKLIRARLDTCPVDIQMHELLAFVLQEMGREDEAGIHIDWYNGLLDSIIESGDGRTPETAFVTISIAEEYNLIRAFGFTVQSQALTSDSQDLFTVVDESGQEYSMYFFPELHWQRLIALFPDPDE